MFQYTEQLLFLTQ